MRMNHSFLLGIAINKFKDESIKKLDYSQIDYCRIQRAAYILYGLNDSEKIFESKATRINILNTLKKDYSLFDNLFIYFSSHGIKNKAKPYLLCYDSHLNDLENTAISLDEIIDSLHQSKAKNITLLIDACQMPFKQQTLNHIRILTPGKELARETSYYQQSLFTKVLLYSTTRQHLKATDFNQQSRMQRLRKQVFYRSLKKNCLFLSGKAATGKSHFLRSIERQENHSHYISIPKLKQIRFEFILTLLSEKITLDAKEQWMNSNALDPEKYLRFFSNSHPHATLLIDHFDHLNQDTAEILYTFLNKLPITTLIATRTCPIFIKSTQCLEFPELNPADVIEFINEQFPGQSSLQDVPRLLQSKDYISLLTAIHSQQTPSLSKKPAQEIKKICQAIAICGGFIHLECFAKYFQINIPVIQQLIQQGLINQHHQFFYPHDIIYEEPISKHDVDELKERAKQYWKEEAQTNEDDPNALHSYILLLNNFEFDWNETEATFYQWMILKLKGRQNSYYLFSLYNYLEKQEIPDRLRISLCEALIENGRFDQASNLIHNHSHKASYFALIAELLWWQGHFESCIKQSSLFLSQTPESQTRLLCSRGIGYFFLGQWPEASSDLSQVIDKSPPTEAKERYLAYCVQATIQGLRGADFQGSVENFIEAIKIARQAGQIAWIALIYGNIGEMFWKSGFINQAIETLKTADHLAYLTDNEALRLEINRNLLHALHRKNDLKASQRQLKTLEERMKEESENYVKMQIINSLLTHYIFFQKNKYQKLIPEAEKLTENNHEYSIYTLSNKALAALFTQTPEKAEQTMEEALMLCQKGENWLAMKQCMDDWDTVINSHRLRQTLSKQAFQKWHQVIQTKLSPGLCHLEALFAFLQLC